MQVIHKSAGARNLSSARSIGLPLFLPDPHRVAPMGRNPHRRSDLSGRTAFQRFRSHTPICPL